MYNLKCKIVIAVIAAITLTFASCGDNNTPEPPVDPNAAITNPVSDYGQMPGKFSVSADKQVRFSQGNLQYRYVADTETNRWRFATNQWDAMGKEENEKIARGDSCWIDLFGWGTGKNPGAMCANISQANYHDWGENPILNGANQPNQWRTLTQSEWVYLLHKRTKAAERCGLGTVNGVHGLILLPDDWENLITLPGLKSCSEKFSDNGATGYKYEDANKNDHFEDNVFSADTWQKLEEKGAIFLPASGEYNKNGYVIDVDVYGYYWTSVSPADMAYALTFNKYFINGQTTLQKNQTSASVRLVRNVE